MANISLRAFARQNDWNPSYAHKLKTEGRLVMVTVDGRELVDSEASMERISQSRDLAKGHMADVNAQQRAVHRGTDERVIPQPSMSMGSSSTNSTYHQAKTAREVFEAKNAQLDFEERAGRLVNVEIVRTRWQASAAALSSAIRQVAGRIAPLLAPETDPGKVERMLLAELDRVLLEQSGRKPA